MPSVRTFLQNEFRQFRELSRLFFGRFLENDLICLDGDTTATLSGILALLAAPSLFIPFFEFVNYGSAPACFFPWYLRDLASIPDKAIHVALAMTVLGIVTVLEWDAILPDRRDYAVLRPLPIPLSLLFGAKVFSLLRFWAVFTLVTSALSCVFFPIAIMQKGSFDMLVWFIRSHAIAILAGNAFIFLAMIGVQGLLLNVLGWRGYRRFAPYAQSILIALLLVMFFVSIGASIGIRPARPANSLMLALPPVWFVGLYERELGWTQPVFQQLARQAWVALGLAAAFAALAYALSYQRSATKSFEDAEGPASVPGLLRNAMTALANRWLLRTPAERASFHFVWHTLMRSRSHRVLVGSCAGVGFAIVFQSLAGVMASGSRSWWHSPRGVLLPVPLVLSLFLLAGLRYAFTVPAELRANWLFQLAGTAAPREYLAGMRKAAAIIGIIPLYAVLLPVHVTLWGWVIGGLHTLYGAVVAYLLLDLFLLGLDKLPFTCSYVPGKANLKARWPLYVGGYLGYISLFSGIEFLLLEDQSRFVPFLCAAAIAKVAIEFGRRRMLAGEFALLYDERPEPAVRTLGLQE
jgi:hypothetical protein